MGRCPSRCKILNSCERTLLAQPIIDLRCMLLCQIWCMLRCIILVTRQIFPCAWKYTAFLWAVFLLSSAVAPKHEVLNFLNCLYWGQFAFFEATCDLKTSGICGYGFVSLIIKSILLDHVVINFLPASLPFFHLLSSILMRQKGIV